MNTPAGGSGITGRKRFYRHATVGETTVAGSPTFRVLLDGRTVRTPAKRELVVKSRALADALAQEWQRQSETIDPGTMPLTRLLNSAIDGVEDRMAEVRRSILAYGGSDLLCYLADGPEELVQRQSRRWGEVHAWIAKAFGAELELAVGVMPVAQDEAMLARLDAAMGDRSALELAALHVITSTTGSLLLALAVLHRRLSPADAWALAHLDDDFQIEQWGADHEASERRARRWTEMETACLALHCSTDENR